MLDYFPGAYITGTVIMLVILSR